LEEKIRMAVETPIPVRYEQVFSHGAYIVGSIEPVYAYDKVTGAKQGQATHPVTGELMWHVTIVDPDPKATGAAKTVKVKYSSPYQPLPPDPVEGHPFTPVVFDEMWLTPYVVEVMPGRFKVAYSIQARGMSSPSM
jgi:hypothetical protein